MHNLPQRFDERNRNGQSLETNFQDDIPRFSAGKFSPRISQNESSGKCLAIELVTLMNVRIARIQDEDEVSNTHSLQ